MNNDLFYEMIKKWVIRDHYNPGLKAEVIWDMLLSEFIPALICYKQSKDEEYDKYRLLAKEFPLKARDDQSGLSNARMDYLVYYGSEKEKCLYLVELKTTNTSFDKGQFERYVKYVENVENEENEWVLWKFYKDVLEKNIRQRYIAGREDNDSKAKYLKHIKYLHQVMDIIGMEHYDLLAEYKKAEGDRVIKAHIKDKFSEQTAQIRKVRDVRLVYISLYDIALEIKSCKEIAAVYEKLEGEGKILQINLANEEFCKQESSGFSDSLTKFSHQTHRVDPFTKSGCNTMSKENWEKIAGIIREIKERDETLGIVEKKG